MGVSGKQDCGHTCQCQANYKSDKVPSETIFSPIKKMKVLKKIKKRMGLAPRTDSSCPGPNNLPPLTFHSVHGDNIRISRDGKIARRYESFCKGIAFSARPVKVNERICVKFSEISNNWSGVIRLGFTCMDPSTLSGTLPKYACPDLTNKPGFWGKALHERFCHRNNVLFYYVTSNGEVHYGINGEEKGLFITDVDTRNPLWVMLDVYGNSIAAEFLDSRTYNSVAVQVPLQDIQPQIIAEACDDGRRTSVQLANEVNQTNSRPTHRMSNVSLHSNASNNTSRRLTVYNPRNSMDQVVQVPAPEYPGQHPVVSMMLPAFTPMQMSTMTGRNVIMSSGRTVVSRIETEFCQGYVFTERPIRYGEQFIIQILKTENIYGGSLAMGLTACNPNTLSMGELPDDSDLLLDRPEYWVVSKDVGQIVSMKAGDEIKFQVTSAGEVQISRNDNAPITLMYVDQSLQLWAFFDVYGSTQSIRVLSRSQESPIYQVPINPPMIAPSNNCSAGAQTPVNGINGVRNGNVQVQSSGTVLVVNLPAARSQSNSLARLSNSRLNARASTDDVQTRIPVFSSALANYNNVQQYDSGHVPGVDCTICYENPIDSCLVSCGHLCMCIECAMKHWRGGVGGGVCPICRSPISDVIRTYRA